MQNNRTRDPPSINERRSGERKIFFIATIISVVAHFLIFVLFPTKSLEINDFVTIKGTEVMEIAENNMMIQEKLPEIPRPVEPKEIVTPVEPKEIVTPEIDIKDDITIVPPKIDDIVLKPPPPLPPIKPVIIERKKEKVGAIGSLWPHITNRNELSRFLSRNYPTRLQTLGIEGTVILDVLIDEEGKIIDVKIHESSGNQDLDRLALNAVDIIEFSPAFIGGNATKVWARLPITFQLR